MNGDKRNLNGLAKEIIAYSKNVLAVELRFLCGAMAGLSVRPYPSENSLYVLSMTDGDTLYYNPVSVLKSFRNDASSFTREYLHILLHCIFRHPYVGKEINKDLWDVACDITVENIINELGIFQTTEREERQNVLLLKIKDKIKIVTAEMIYNYFNENGFSDGNLEDYKIAFISDGHEIWYMTEQEKSTISSDGENNTAEQSDEKSNAENSKQNDGDEKNKIKNKNGDKKGKNGDVPSRGESEKRWSRISEQVREDLETFSKKHGDKAGSLAINISSINREKYDYEAFLKKFTEYREITKINDEEFDYVYYTYGLKLYKNMPLVEPLEYKEDNKIRDFAVAVDTSESVSLETVKKFLSKTYAILNQNDAFSNRINLHIIQCDAKVQQDIKITTREEFENCISSFKIIGRGGTDFRPVFEYIDELIEKGEFTSLKGLIYFTDGFGKFPENMPNYKTAFLYLDDGVNNYDVPPWAIKLVLESRTL